MARTEGETQRDPSTEFQHAARPLYAELARAGFNVEDLQDMRWPDFPGRGSEPILLKWVASAENDMRTRLGALQVLSSKWVDRSVIGDLVRIYETVPAEHFDLKFTLAGHIEVGSAQVPREKLLELATDRGQGSARVPIVVALGKYARDPRVAAAILQSLDDPNVMGAAAAAAGRARLVAAKPKLEAMAAIPGQGPQTIARQALRKIAKAEAAGKAT